MRKSVTYLTEMQIKKMKEISEYKGLPTAEVVRRAIDFYIEKIEKEIKKEKKEEKKTLHSDET